MTLPAGQSHDISLAEAEGIQLSGLSVLDITPAGQIDAADAGYTNDRNVRLVLAVAAGGNSVLQVRASETTDLSDAEWSTEFTINAAKDTITLDVELSEDDGAKTVYAQVRSSGDDVSNVVSAPATLDTVAPADATWSFMEGEKVATTTAHLQLACEGASHVRMVSAGSNATAWALGALDAWIAVPDSEAISEVTLAAGLGSKTVTLLFRDHAGNISTEVYASIELSQAGASAPEDFDSDKAESGVWTDDSSLHTFTWDVPTFVGGSGIKQYRYTSDGTLPTTGSGIATTAAKTFQWQPFAYPMIQRRLYVRAEMNDGTLGDVAWFDLWVDTGSAVIVPITPPDGGLTNDPSAVLTAEITAGGSGYVAASVAFTVDETEYGQDSGAISQDGNRWTFNPALLATPFTWTEAEHTWSVTLEDNPGNDVEMDAATFTADFSPPTFEVTCFSDSDLSLPVLAAKAGALWLRIEASEAVVGDSVSALVTRPGTADPVRVTAYAVSDTVFRARYDVLAADGSLYLDGMASVAVSGTGLAGNVVTDDTPTSGDEIEIDTAGDTVTLSYSRHRRHLAAGALEITAAFSDVTGGTPSLWIEDAEGDVVVAAADMSGSGTGWAITVNFPDLPEGEYVVCLDAPDVAGNPPASILNADLWVDKTPAVLSGLRATPAVASLQTGYDVVQITFRANEPLASAAVTVGGVAATLAGSASGARLWTFEYAVTGDETEGEAEIAVEVEDLAGNTSEATGSVIFDFTGPDIEVTEPDEDGDEIEDMELAWTWEDPNGVAHGEARITLNGADITSRCAITPNGGEYRP